VELIRQEEAAHGNDVQALSIDGVGFNGPVLRELEDPDGLNIDTYVPPPKDNESPTLTPDDFEEDAERGVVTCPAGQTSTQRSYDHQKQTTKYRFNVATCRECPMVQRCMKGAPRQHGRTVCKTDFQAEHDRVPASSFRLLTPISSLSTASARHSHLTPDPFSPLAHFFGLQAACVLLG
jgi:hypothetical protein